MDFDNLGFGIYSLVLTISQFCFSSNVFHIKDYKVPPLSSLFHIVLQQSYQKHDWLQYVYRERMFIRYFPSHFCDFRCGQYRINEFCKHWIGLLENSNYRVFEPGFTQIKLVLLLFCVEICWNMFMLKYMEICWNKIKRIMHGHTVFVHTCWYR